MAKNAATIYKSVEQKRHLNNRKPNCIASYGSGAIETAAERAAAKRGVCSHLPAGRQGRENIAAPRAHCAPCGQKLGRPAVFAPANRQASRAYCPDGAIARQRRRIAVDAAIAEAQACIAAASGERGRVKIVFIPGFACYRSSNR